MKISPLFKIEGNIPNLGQSPIPLPRLDTESTEYCLMPEIFWALGMLRSESVVLYDIFASLN